MPMVLGNIFQLFYNVVDSMVVGNYIGKEALAAVGASFPILFTLISLIVGISTGATIVISQYFGAKKIDKVKKAIDTLFIFLFLASIVMGLLGIIFAEDIFRLIKLPEDAMAEAVLYLRIYLSGLIFFFGFNGTSAVLRGLGDSKTPLYFLIIATVINVGLDILFVIVFGWGVEGVALATLIAQCGAFFTIIFYLNRTHEIIDLTFRRLQFDRLVFKQNLRIGFPIGFQMAFVALSMMVMYWLVNPFGTDVVAAYSVVFRIDSFASMPAMNFAAALAAFVGQNLGAEKPERVKQGLVSTFYMTSLIALTVSFIAIIFSNPLMKMFTTDMNVVRIGVQYLHIVSFFYVAFTGMFTIGGVMRGAGDTLLPMVFTFISLWIIRVPLCYFMSQKMGTVGIWWGIPIAWIVGLILSYLYYLTGKWKTKTVFH